MALERFFIHDFFTAIELDRIDKRIRRGHLAGARQRTSQARRIEEMECGLGRVALLARALAELCLEKGVLTPAELRARLQAVDPDDGVTDGRLDSSVVLPGESKLAELEPLSSPPPPPRPRKRRH